MGSWAYRFYIGRIRKAQSRDDVQRTVRLTRHYTRFYPDDPDSWQFLAVALMEAEDPEAALTAIREGVRRFPLSPGMGRMLAKVLIANGEHSEARATLEEIIRRSPDSPLPYLELADLSLGEGKDDDARTHLLLGLELASPTDWWIRTMLAKRLVGFPGDRKQATEVLKACAATSKDWSVHEALAAALAPSDPETSRKHADRAKHLLGRGATIDIDTRIRRLSHWMFDKAAEMDP